MSFGPTEGCMATKSDDARTQHPESCRTILVSLIRNSEPIKHYPGSSKQPGQRSPILEINSYDLKDPQRPQ